VTIEAIQSQAPRAVAVELIRAEYVADPELFVRALMNWLLITVTIFDEFEELLISPIIMLDEIERRGSTFGDCDDVAMLGASILASAGALCRLTACFPQDDGSYGHVIVQYKFPRQEDFRDFDPTIGYNWGAYPADTLSVDIIS